MQPSVGFVLPGTVTVYPLPTTMNVPNASLYNYSLINGHPVIVDRHDPQGNPHLELTAAGSLTGSGIRK